MPNDNHDKSTQNLGKDWLALNTLRDYVYQNKPHKFLATDFVEDIPSLRPVGSAFANVLPTAAILSKDPTERKEQVAQAVHKIQRASKKDHPVMREALTSAAKFGLGSIPLSLGFGLAEKSFHLPGLHNLLKGERPRITFKDNFKTPEAKNELKRYLRQSVTQGMAQGAVFGTIPALTSSSAKFDKQNLDNASKVLNEHPNMSAFPGADLAILNNLHKDKNIDPTSDHFHNVLQGAGLGAGLATATQGLKSVGKLTHNLISPLKYKVDSKLHEIIQSKLQSKFRGRSNTKLKEQGLHGLNSSGRAAFGRANVGLLKSLKDMKPKAPTKFSPSEVLSSLHPRAMAKPVLSFALLGAGLSGLGSYLSHPARKNV
jgi:hypothetical protein